MTTATAKRITLATVKSFVKNNRSNLLINCKSRFDSMVDGVRECSGNEFNPALNADGSPCSHNLGIQGAWFVFQSRDWFSTYETETYIGYEISNSCGRFILAVAK